MIRRSLAAAFIVLLMTGFSPAVRVETRVVVPGVAAPDPKKFHLRGARRCPPGPVEKPDVTAERDGAISREVDAAAGGLRVEVAFAGGHCMLRFAAWYDANGNGVVDRGDATAETEAIEVKDRGLCVGNLTRVPDITLKSVVNL